MKLPDFSMSWDGGWRNRWAGWWWWNQELSDLPPQPVKGKLLKVTTMVVARMYKAVMGCGRQDDEREGEAMTQKVWKRAGV